MSPSLFYVHSHPLISPVAWRARAIPCGKYRGKKDVCSLKNWVCQNKTLLLHTPNENALVYMHNELVSVIMPMHNSAKYVGEAIASVIAQTYPHWELIVIDDVSTDNSCDIVRQCQAQDSRIHLLFNDNHTGRPSSPRNVGVKHAKGHYIAFLDSDDIWFPEKLQQQIPLFENEKVAIVYSNYEKMDEDGHRANRVVKAPSYATYRSLLSGNVIGNLTGIYDKEKVGKVEFLDIHHEDYVLWLSILKKGFIAQNTHTTTAAYRILKSSISSNKLQVLPWQWSIYRDIERLSLLSSVYHFINYAVKAYFKSKI